MPTPVAWLKPCRRCREGCAGTGTSDRRRSDSAATRSNDRLRHCRRGRQRTPRVFSAWTRSRATPSYSNARPGASRRRARGRRTRGSRASPCPERRSDAQRGSPTGLSFDASTRGRAAGRTARARGRPRRAAARPRSRSACMTRVAVIAIAQCWRDGVAPIQARPQRFTHRPATVCLSDREAVSLGQA